MFTSEQNFIWILALQTTLWNFKHVKLGEILTGYKTGFVRPGHILLLTDPCDQPVNPGMCDCFTPSYFWNSTSEKCEVFIYSGCDGNLNRFPDLNSCAQHCGKYIGVAVGSYSYIALSPLTAACRSCPKDSECEVHPPSGRAVCKVRCDVNNGGCDANQTCLLANLTCPNPPCQATRHCLSMLMQVNEFLVIAITLQIIIDCTIRPLDVVFVLDTSRSIGNSQFQLFRDFVSGIARALDISLQQSLVGVILFSDEARIQFSLTEFTDKSSLLSAIDDIPYRGGNTNTADALRLLLSSARDGTMELRGGYPHIAIVLTDGESNDPDSTMAAARELRENGRFDQVYAAGVANANISELNAIASNASLVWFTNSFDASAIQELQFDVTRQLCNDLGECFSHQFYYYYKYIPYLLYTRFTICTRDGFSQEAFNTYPAITPHTQNPLGANYLMCHCVPIS